MRLIDADDLIIEILTHDLIDDDKKVDKMILDAPTIKAIPVEWFKNLIKTVEDSKNYEESEILKWALNKWENQEKEKWN